MKLSNDQLERAIKLYVQTGLPGSEVRARASLVKLMEEWGYAVTCIISAVTRPQEDVAPKCHACNGTGWKNRSMWTICDACQCEEFSGTQQKD